MRQLLAATALIAVLAGCSGGAAGAPGAPTAATPQKMRTRSAPAAVKPDASGNAVANAGFESGALTPWTACGGVSSQTITTAKAHTGTYSVLIGKTAKPEVDGYAAICQTVSVPAGATLSFWVYEGTNDTIEYADQEADLFDSSGNFITELYADAASTNAWVQKSFDLSAYAGQTLQLYFGVDGNGYAGDYVYEYLDDVSLTSAGGTPAPTTTPTVAPTVKPTVAPTASATATPTQKPTTSPTVAPTAIPSTTPSTTPFACNDSQFTTYQNEFAAGSISGDQFVDICGSVTQVLAEKKTASGNHGYFYVALPSGYQIEIVSNLDAMAQASTDKPPSTWPWVAVNQYVYVQGRYYYDNSSSQGVDWTEDDTSSSWMHLGYVAVCDDSGANCQKYW